MRNDRSTFPGIAVWLAGGVTLAAWSVLAWRSQNEGTPLAWMLTTMGLSWSALACAAIYAHLRHSGGILAVGIACRTIALWAEPVMEDDHYRFLWDGYRFATTGNPYAEPPQASFHDPSVPAEFLAILDRINHPDVPTIYGPLTEWVFRLGHALAPAQLWPWKIALLGADLALMMLLWRGLSIGGRLLLAWCPLAVLETGFNAHPDALALALVVAAWRLRDHGRLSAAGFVAGLAVTAKIFAIFLLPFVLWRMGRRAWLAAAAAVVTLYAPFWLRGSSADLAGLRAMAAEWEFNSSIYAVVSAATSPAIARLGCGLAFAGAWLAIFRRWSASRVHESLPPGELIYGAFLLLSAVANPWYALWLWPFVATRISATGVTALTVVSLAYVTGLNLGNPSLGNFGHPWWLRPVEFGALGHAGLCEWRRKKTACGSS